MQAKRTRILSAVLALVLAVSLLPGVTISAAENPFTDVGASDYYYSAVLWAVENSVTAGVTPTSFAPKATCTRAQMVSFLWRAMGKPAHKSDENPFTDVKTADYYYDAVLWAVENSVTYGTSATAFSPETTVTRGQVVTFLWRAAGSPAPQSDTTPFTDVTDAQYYYKAVLWAVEKGITFGTSKVTFAPEETCIRAQIVSFLHRYMNSTEIPDTPDSERLTITAQPTSATVKPREKLTTLSVKIAGGKAPYTYAVEQYFEHSGWKVIATQWEQTAKTWTYQGTASDLLGDYRYRLTVTDDDGSMVISEEIIITVVSDLRIQMQPTSATVVPNTALTSLSVSVLGGSGPYTYTLEEYYEKSGWKAIYTEWEQASTNWAYYGIAENDYGSYRYRITITDAVGSKIISDEVIITVASDLRIILQPISASLEVGAEITTLSIAISGGKAPYTYRLECYNASNCNWEEISYQSEQSEKAWSFDGLVHHTSGTYRYRIAVTDATGTEVISNEARIFVSVYSDQSIQVGAKSYQLGMTENQLISLAGQPSEQLAVFEGYTWYIYGAQTYTDFIMAGIYQGKVVALCASGPGFSYQGYTMADQNPNFPASSSCYVSALTDKNDGGRFHCIWVQAKSYNPTLRGDLTALLANEARVDFHLVNAFRAYYGQRILTWNDKLATSARLHSADMAANHYFDHTGRNGSQPWDRVEAQGVSFYSCGENIAAGQENGIDVHNAWVNSAGHRANILDSGFTQMGTGIAYLNSSDYGVYYTENFIGA